MPNSLFDGLSGLMNGLSGFLPQDDPDVRILNAQNEINELQKQEAGVFIQLGKEVIARNPQQFPEQEEKLRVIRASLNEAQAKLTAAQKEKEQKERAQQIAEAQVTCPSCGFRNPDGVKFCQECGAKLGVNLTCPSCGVAVVPGVRFCGACGARLE